MESSIKRPTDNVKRFVTWLEQHSPFKGNQYLKNIATGRVADASINCDQAIEIGRNLALLLDEKTFGMCKLKSKDKVMNMTQHHNIKLHGEEKIVNPEILFHRICCTINDNSSEMKEYLKYELTQGPPSLF